MMNSFIQLELKPNTKGRGGAFFAAASFKIDNITMPFESVEIKVDTGCSISTVPLRRYRIADTVCRSLKRQDIEKDVEYVISYGVESSGTKHVIPQTLQEKMDCSAMKFLHRISGFELDGVKIPVNDIYINYNRKGNTLIGMDILDMLDIHMGESKKDGKYRFIACMKNCITPEYIGALEEHFGLTGVE